MFRNPARKVACGGTAGTFANGSRVELHGLVVAPYLNRAVGRVLRFDGEAQRYVVELVGGVRKLVRGVNLCLVPLEADCALVSKRSAFMSRAAAAA